MIAHQPLGIVKTYVVYAYLDEKRRGFGKWEERLSDILLQRDYRSTSNVVALHG
ncbi:MAG: hypothetical protein QOK44_1639 [Betaproteobacteria bacterium]|jgi:hypothetical protein|nr:hypothetical protein [Betaproteobacteria bacterium]